MEKSYPVYYQYGKYSVNIDEMSERDLELLREAVRSLDIELVYRGANF